MIRISSLDCFKSDGKSTKLINLNVDLIQSIQGGHMMSVEEISFQIILYGGNARTLAMEAMKHAKASEFELAEQKIEEANEEMSKAHRYQTDLIQGEIRGEEVELRLLLIHAQDHLMNAITVIDLAQEVIELHKKINLSKGDYYVKS